MALVETTATGGGVWLTIAELARRKGISKQAAAKRVDKLERDGLISTRRNGRNREIELATYDRVVGQVGDAAKEQAAETRRELTGQGASEGNGSGLRDAQTERAKYDAQLKALDLAERQGQLIAVRGEHGLEAALLKVTEMLIRDLNAPMNWVGEIADAAREGEPAIRRLMRKKVRELRQTVADHLAELGGEAAEAEKTGIQIDLMFGDEQ